VFKIVAADPESGKSYSLEAHEPAARRLVGLRIGEKFDGEIVGLSGYELEITGGTDKDGFPMRSDVHGSGRTYLVLSGGVGYKPRGLGERRRKRVRGRTISDDIVQINAKIVKKGEKPLEELAPKGKESKS
jgi:small subunit ribosomal protein S6e